MGSTWEDVSRPRSRQGLGPDYSLQLIPAVWEPPSAVGYLAPGTPDTIAQSLPSTPTLGSKLPPHLSLALRSLIYSPNIY